MESRAEAKATRELFGGAQAVADEFNTLLKKCSLWKTLRVCALMSRSIGNFQINKEQRSKGPLTTNEIDQQRMFWVKRAQKSCMASDQFEEEQQQLNLQENDSGVWECHGSIMRQLRECVKNGLISSYVRTLSD